MRAALLFLAACTVSPFDGGGKQCPCIEGYICNRVSNVCEPLNAPMPEGRVVVSKLRVLWTTGNSIHWRWDIQGDPKDFREYELVTGKSEIDVIERKPGVHVWNKAENPELGLFRGNDRTLNGDPLDPYTVTDEHAPGEKVFAQVIGFDVAGNITRSNVMSATTTKPTENKVIFTEADMAGASVPTGFARSTDRPYQGRYCYLFPVKCATATCFQQVERNKLAVAVTGMDAAQFDNAYLELAVSGARQPAGFVSEVGLFFGPESCNATNTGAACRWRWQGFTFPGEDRYRLVQVPLKQLKKNDGKALTYDEMKTQTFALWAITLNGTWMNATTVRFDEIRIRW